MVVKVAVKSFKIVDFTEDLAASESKGNVHVQPDDNSYNTIQPRQAA